MISSPVRPPDDDEGDHGNYGIGVVGRRDALPVCLRRLLEAPFGRVVNRGGRVGWKSLPLAGVVRIRGRSLMVPRGRRASPRASGTSVLATKGAPMGTDRGALSRAAQRVAVHAARPLGGLFAHREPAHPDGADLQPRPALAVAAVLALAPAVDRAALGLLPVRQFALHGCRSRSRREPYRPDTGLPTK